MNLNILRRPSAVKTPEIDEDELRQLAMQRRRSSIAIIQHDDEPIFPTAISPTIEIFPNSTSKRQQTLLISPDPLVNGYAITCAKTDRRFLTVVTPQTALPGPSHTKHFYGTLNSPWQSSSDRKNSDGSDSDKDETDPSKKLCNLERDSLSFRKRHYVQDPHNNRQLLAMEFNYSSWDAGAMKASIELLNKYSHDGTMNPIRLKWKGKKASLEGVLEVNHKAVAVCAKGLETQAGEYALYVAPGMDLYVCAIVVMAVDDRVRRVSGDNNFSPSLSPNINPDFKFNRTGSYGFGKKDDEATS